MTTIDPPASVELDDVRVHVDADIVEEVVVGVPLAVRTVLGWFDSHPYCLDARVWISPQDNDGERGSLYNRARLVQRPARNVLVVGAEPVADQVRALLRHGCGGWRLHELPEAQTPLEILEAALGHRAYNMLTREGYRTCDEVAATPEASLLNVRNIGRKSLAAIRDAVAAHTTSTAAADSPTDVRAEDATCLEAMTIDQLRTLWTAVVWELQRRGALAIPSAPRADS